MEEMLRMGATIEDMMEWSGVSMDELETEEN